MTSAPLSRQRKHEVPLENGDDLDKHAGGEQNRNERTELEKSKVSILSNCSTHTLRDADMCICLFFEF